VRGGGGNFGVVTEFVFQLHPQRKTVYAGTILFSAEEPTLTQLVNGTKAWWAKLQEGCQDESMQQVVMVLPGGRPVVAANLFFNGSEQEGREKFKWIFDIGPFEDLTREMPYEELNGMQVWQLPTSLPVLKVDYPTSRIMKRPTTRATISQVLLSMVHLTPPTATPSPKLPQYTLRVYSAQV